MFFEGDLPLEDAFTFDGWFAPVRVDSMIRGLTKTSFDLFYGKIDHLNFDPQEWRWSDDLRFFLYSYWKKEEASLIAFNDLASLH